MSKRSLLIVDLRWRSLSAVLVRKDGGVVPCIQSFSGIRNTKTSPTRYLSCDVLREDAQPERDAERVRLLLQMVDKFHASGGFWSKVGLLRPWDITDANTDASLVMHPLQVLSTPVALEDPNVYKQLQGVASLWTDVLLEPVFNCLGQHGLLRTELEAIVIVPSNLSRSAALALWRAFCRRDCWRVRMIPRELAGALNSIDEGSPEILVVDMEADDLVVHCVRFERVDGTVQVCVEGSRTISGFGWSFWVSAVDSALKDAERGARGTKSFDSIDRALLILLGAPYSAASLGDWPLQMSYGLLQGIGSGLRARHFRSLQEGLAGALAELSVSSEAPWIGLGVVFGLGPLAALIREAIGSGRPELGSDQPAIGRAVQGVVSAFGWLRRARGRHVALASRASIWLNTVRGTGVELLPASSFCNGVPHRRSRQVVRLRGPISHEERLAIHLFWGTNPDPRYSRPLGVFSIPSEGIEDGSEFRFALEVRSACGRQPRGFAEVRQAGETVQVNLAAPFSATSLSWREALQGKTRASPRTRERNISKESGS